MLEACAVAALRLGNVLAQLPERGALALAARQRRIEHRAGVERGGQRLLEDAAERLAARAADSSHSTYQG